jgi:hypothetical protein
MTDQERNFAKFKTMGFDNLPKGIHTRTVVCETAKLAREWMLNNIVNVSGPNPNLEAHGVNVCMVIDEAAAYRQGTNQKHYISDRFEAIDYAMANNIKVITQSSGFIWSEAYKAKVKAFRDWGGVLVNSAGNSTQNDPTQVPAGYAISVGTIGGGPDNSGSTIVGYTEYRLRSWDDTSNIFPGTSGAAPAQADAISCLIEAYRFKPDEIDKLIKDNKLTGLAGLEDGEALLYIPKLGPAYPKRVIELFINGKAYVDGKEVPIDVPAQITSGRTLVPVRFIAEALRLEVGFDKHPITRSVTKVILKEL